MFVLLSSCCCDGYIAVENKKGGNKRVKRGKRGEKGRKEDKEKIYERKERLFLSILISILAISS